MGDGNDYEATKEAAIRLILAVQWENAIALYTGTPPDGQPRTVSLSTLMIPAVDVFERMSVRGMRRERRNHADR